MKRKAMKVTAQLYGQFLVSSQVNYTGTYLADHLEGLTHDNVRYFLKNPALHAASALAAGAPAGSVERTGLCLV